MSCKFVLVCIYATFELGSMWGKVNNAIGIGNTHCARGNMNIIQITNNHEMSWLFMLRGNYEYASTKVNQYNTWQYNWTFILCPRMSLYW